MAKGQEQKANFGPEVGQRRQFLEGVWANARNLSENALLMRPPLAGFLLGPEGLAQTRLRTLFGQVNERREQQATSPLHQQIATLTGLVRQWEYNTPTKPQDMQTLVIDAVAAINPQLTKSQRQEVRTAIADLYHAEQRRIIANIATASLAGNFIASHGGLYPIDWANQEYATALQTVAADARAMQNQTNQDGEKTAEAYRKLNELLGLEGQTALAPTGETIVAHEQQELTTREAVEQAVLLHLQQIGQEANGVNTDDILALGGITPEINPLTWQIAQVTSFEDRGEPLARMLTARTNYDMVARTIVQTITQREVANASSLPNLFDSLAQFGREYISAATARSHEPQDTRHAVLTNEAFAGAMSETGRQIEGISMFFTDPQALEMTYGLLARRISSLMGNREGRSALRAADAVDVLEWYFGQPTTNYDGGISLNQARRMARLEGSQQRVGQLLDELNSAGRSDDPLYMLLETALHAQTPQMADINEVTPNQVIGNIKLFAEALFGRGNNYGTEVARLSTIIEGAQASSYAYQQLEDQRRADRSDEVAARAEQELTALLDRIAQG